MIKKRFNSIVFVILFLLSTSFVKNNIRKQPKDKFIVVLDAGHGGHDPGNIGNGYLEKNIALAIVIKIGELLEQKKDIEVIYTRDDDTFVDLFERGQIANKANANLFVSVHCDSHTTPDPNGAGTFVLGLHANKQNFEVAKKENSVIYLEDNYEQKYADYNINSPESVIGLTVLQEEFLDQSIQLAKLMQDNFTKKLSRKDRKVKQAGFIVLHQTFMPSVLVETGFLTNKSEGSYLNSTKGQNDMGTAIANAILSYKDGVDANFVELDNTTIAQNESPTEEVIEKKIKEDVTVTPTTEIATEDKKILADKQPVTQQELPQKETIDKKVKEEVAIKNIEESPAVEDKLTKTKQTEIPKPINKEEVKPTNVVFKVQLMASGKTIALDASNFKGLDNLSKEPIKNLYRYMYGNTDSYSDALLLKSTAETKGYKGAFIVAYKNGKRILLQEALKSVPKQ